MDLRMTVGLVLTVVALGIAAVFGLGIGVLVGRRFHRSS